MDEYNPDMWIMKITPGGSGNTKMYFENLFVKQGCKKLIGYSKDAGDIEKFTSRWNEIKKGDLIIIIEGYNRVFGVVEITSNPFDDENEEGDEQSDWFYHRRRAELVKYFDPFFEAKSNTNRDTIIQYSGEGAVGICDEVWNKIKDEFVNLKRKKTMERKLNLLRYKKQIILQGPPGTGKTRLAHLMADELLKSERKLTPMQYVDWYIKNYKSTKELKEKSAQQLLLLNEFVTTFSINNIKNLTLESYCLGKGSQTSFCYWIEKKLGKLGMFSPGQAGTTVYGVWYNQEGKDYKSTDKTPEAKMKEIAVALNSLLADEDNSPAKQIFRQSLILKILNSYFPEKYFPIFSQNHLKLVAKMLEIKTSGLDDIQLNSQINQKLLDIKNNYSSDISNLELMRHLYGKFDLKKGNIDLDEVEIIDSLGEKKLIQFHPAYTYEDFVRGITTEITAKGQVEYKVVNKVLAEFAQKALDNQSINYVLIIDEINRANLPSVLGELIYALEYRYDPERPKENIVDSMYALKAEDSDQMDDRSLKLPKNLYIIGTMNTADRSVGHIDYAIKRRFAFVNVLPTASVIDEVINDPELRKTAKDLFVKVSQLFSEVSSEHKIYLQSDFKANDVQLGHSYFLAEDLSQLEMKLEFEIKPILLEYVKDGVLSQDAEKSISDLSVNE